MANPKLEFRFPPIMLAYLNDLASLGPYGKDRAEVAKRFIERGVQEALEKGVVKARKPNDSNA